jgi:hypothetical protein
MLILMEVKNIEPGVIFCDQDGNEYQRDAYNNELYKKGTDGKIYKASLSDTTTLKFVSYVSVQEEGTLLFPDWYKKLKVCYKRP